MRKVDSFVKQEYPITKIELKQSNPDAPENSGAYPKFLITYGLLGDEEANKNTSND